MLSSTSPDYSSLCYELLWLNKNALMLSFTDKRSLFFIIGPQNLFGAPPYQIDLTQS
jgi:hypothetical protein